MTLPRWLSVKDITAIHAEQLARFGGPSGIRDLGLLEYAMARPVNTWNYGETDMAALAACYAGSLSQNHPFVDGNKRAAFAAMMVLLRLNGILFRVEPAEATAAIMALAAGEIDEAILSHWIRDRMPDVDKGSSKQS
ncbi:MAG: type II toxin-antitoxin system death-on-curing family toxin [Pseudomonadota bacterium]